MATQGQNVWYDLLTTDIPGAVRFYGEVIGWRTKPWEKADPSKPYTMWVASDGPIGGVMALPDDAKKAGAPAHWVSYTAVDDVDKAASRAVALGGTVVSKPFDVPDVGRIAVLSDPQGAVFAIYKPLSDAAAPDDRAGHFSWAELNTTDYEGAWKFYSELFGWRERGSKDLGDDKGTYFMFQDAAEKTKGGMSNLATMMNMPAHWMHYVTVDDMNATLDRIQRNGGKVLNGPMPIPGDDVIAQCMDPQGALFAVYAAGRKGA